MVFVGQPSGRRPEALHNISLDVRNVGSEEKWTDGTADRIGMREIVVSALDSRAKCDQSQLQSSITAESGEPKLSHKPSVCGLFNNCGNSNSALPNSL